MTKDGIRQQLLLQAFFGDENSQGPLPAECRDFIFPALEALPEGDYVMLDEDSHYELAEHAVARWPVAEHVGSWNWEEGVTEGYGSLDRVTTEAGPGFVYNFGGSPMNGPRFFAVVPASADLPRCYD